MKKSKIFMCVCQALIAVALCIAALNTRAAVLQPTGMDQTTGQFRIAQPGEGFDISAIVGLQTALDAKEAVSALPTTLSQFTNNTNFITSAGAPVQSVSGRTGTVTLSTSDISGYLAPPTTTSQLTNNSSFITSAGAPVQSVAGRTGAVVLGESDITSLSTDLAKLPKFYSGNSLQATPKFYTSSAVVSGGVAVFQVTTDNTSTGTAIFPSGPISTALNGFVSDAAASYQMAGVWSNSNKTLTITANKLGTASLITGILGQVAANGATVNITIFGN